MPLSLGYDAATIDILYPLILFIVVWFLVPQRAQVDSRPHPQAEVILQS